jgi:hypothetical protein
MKFLTNIPSDIIVNAFMSPSGGGGNSENKEAIKNFKKIARKILSIATTVYLLRQVTIKPFCTIHSMPVADNYNLPTKYGMGCLMNLLYAQINNMIMKAEW